MSISFEMKLSAACGNWSNGAKCRFVTSRFRMVCPQTPAKKRSISLGKLDSQVSAPPTTLGTGLDLKDSISAAAMQTQDYKALRTA